MVAIGGLALLVALGFALDGVEVDDSLGPGLGAWQIMLGNVPLYVLAVYLIRKRPDNAVSWYFLLAISALAVAIAAEPVLAVTLERGEGAAGWFWAANLGHQWAGIVASAAAAAVGIVFPYGRVERRWHAVVLRALWVLQAVPALLLLTRPDLVLYPLVAHPRPPLLSPFFVPWMAWLGPPLEVILRGNYVVFLLGGAIFLARYVRAGAERAPMRWFVYTAVAFSAVVVAHSGVLLTVGPGPALRMVDQVWVPVESAIAVGLVVGVLRGHLFDLHVVIRRSVVYATLALGIAALYAAVAALPGLAVGRFVPVELAVVLTIAAALAFQPARVRLTAWADRWVFGDRVDPTQLLLGLGSTLEKAVDVADLLPSLADTVRLGLSAAWVRVLLRDENGEWISEPHGAAGDPAGPVVLSVALERAGATLGRIDCGPRTDGYGQREEELLARLAAQAATAIANVRLTAQLARSRERLVHTADSERRRIERDIHDGVQQEVVALMAKLRLARNQVARGDRSATDALTELQGDAKNLLAELRELAHGIHPPVLSDKGLIHAIQARADRLPLMVELRVDAELRRRRFDPDLEVASYFVICEALTNVVKHATATTVEVELSAPERRLCATVTDDGVGFAAPRHSGRGLIGMRDRVEALGGRLHISSTPGRGTRVIAELPTIGALVASPAGTDR
jgi:signal transduction histidine kinase